MTLPTLYVIGTPIGNLKDVTLRALEVLETCEVLVCEDSRVSSRLINYYFDKGLLHRKPRYWACNDFNEKKVASSIIELVKNGQSVGLVSDAGMPMVSDPGYRVIRGCLDAKLKVEVIPGVSSITTALTLAGLGGEQFLFLGFLPKKLGKRTRLWQTVKLMMEQTESLKIVVFPSPHRLCKELSEIEGVIGDVKAVLLRELTKKFEERLELRISELREKYENIKPKGEMVLVLQKAEEA